MAIHEKRGSLQYLAAWVQGTVLAALLVSAPGRRSRGVFEGTVGPVEKIQPSLLIKWGNGEFYLDCVKVRQLK